MKQKKKSNIESKYFTTSDYKKHTDEILNAKIKEKDIVNRSDISGFKDNFDFDKKLQYQQQKQN